MDAVEVTRIANTVTVVSLIVTVVAWLVTGVCVVYRRMTPPPALPTRKRTPTDPA